MANAGGLVGTVLGGTLGGYNGLTDPEFSGKVADRFRHAGRMARGRAFTLFKAFGAFSLIYEASLCVIEKVLKKRVGSIFQSHSGLLSSFYFFLPQFIENFFSSFSDTTTSSLFLSLTLSLFSLFSFFYR
jgi:hypothetical protein